MCFSPEVDVAAGVVLGAVGLESLRHVHRWRDVPLGSLPLLFGVHQVTEAFVWWHLMGDVSASVGRRALWVYMLFAFVVLPLLAPLAVLAVEDDPRRRQLIARFSVLGGLVAAAYLSAMVEGPIRATMERNTLAYHTRIAHGGVLAGLYMFATVGALLSSSHARIQTFGAANLLALPMLTALSTQALTSLWCVWAAVSSVVIVSHIREGEASNLGTPSSRRAQTGPVAPAAPSRQRVIRPSACRHRMRRPLLLRVSRRSGSARTVRRRRALKIPDALGLGWSTSTTVRCHARRGRPDAHEE